jgi:hypothetical protein
MLEVQSSANGALVVMSLGVALTSEVSEDARGT